MKFLLASHLLFVLVSCGGEKGQTSTTSGNMMVANIQDTCSCDELTADTTGLFSKKGKVFTGVCFNNYPNSEARYLEKNLLEGQLHGKVTYFSKEGDVLMEEIYEYGSSKRSSTSGDLNCDCSELKIAGTIQDISKYTLDDIAFTGVCSKHYPDGGKVYMSSTYKDGLLDGSTTYYDRNGETLYVEIYETGIHVNTIYGSED